MADLGEMTFLRNHNETLRLTLRLIWYNDLLYQASTDTGNYMDAAGVAAKTIIDLSNILDIHCLPGNEWEMLHDLRKQCTCIEGLLSVPASNRDTVLEAVREAIQQYCYLRAYQSIDWTAVIERLCLNTEDTLGQRQPHYRTVESDIGRSRAPRRPIESRDRCASRQRKP